MRIIIVIAIICFLSIACQKRKEIKEWKQREGLYNAEYLYLLYQDSIVKLNVNQISINPSGLTCYGSEPKAVNFSVLHKNENPNKNYEYKCQYSSLSGYEIGTGGGMQNTQLGYHQFTQEREFYLSFSGNNLTFTIIKPDGELDNLVFKKQ